MMHAAGMPSGKLTPFMLFYLERRDIVKKYLADLTKPIDGNRRPEDRPEDISREITKLWSELDFESIREYCLLSNLYAESLGKHGSASSSRNVNTNRSSTSTSNSSSNNSHGGNVGNRPRIKPNRRKDSRLPKPSISSFMWFSRHHRSMIRSQNPELSFSEIGRTIGTLWKSATVSERRPFDELAAEDKMRYARELTEYKQWLAQVPKLKERATVAAPEEAATATCTAFTTSVASGAAVDTSTVEAGTASSVILAEPSSASMASMVRAPLGQASQAEFTGTTDVGCLEDHQAVARRQAAQPSDGTPSTLPRKRNAKETAATPEASWSATSPIPFSYEPHSPCAKRQRTEESSPVASAPSVVIAATADVSMSTESLPPTNPLDTMRGVGTTAGCTAYLPQQPQPCERSGSLPENVGVDGPAVRT